MAENICIIPDCGKLVIALSLCSKHYNRQRRWGDPNYEYRARHGLKGLPEYGIWKNMKNRCYNKNSRDYRYYGGRGIQVYEGWLHSFETFLRDVGRRPSPLYTLDRKDTYGNYEPGNVRWTDKFTQAANQRIRTDNKTGIKNISYDKGSKLYIVRIKRKKEVIYYASFHDLETAKVNLALFLKSH